VKNSAKSITRKFGLRGHEASTLEHVGCRNWFNAKSVFDKIHS